jgi:hypothetical protein
MAINKWPGRIVFLAAAIAAIAGALSIGVLSKSHQQKQRTHTLPEIYSKIKNLEVIKATIIDADTPAARVQIEIWNHSSQAVMAVDVVAGESAITKNGLTDEEHPLVVIEAYETTTIEMPLGNIDPGTPLVVSAVTYADGTEEGEAESLKIMHLTRARDKARILAEREKQKGGSKP